MNLTIYQVKMALTVFLAIYAILGVTCLIVYRVISSGIIDAIIEQNLTAEAQKLVGLDVGLGAQVILYVYFLVWGILLLIYAICGAIGLFLENPTLLKAFGFLLLIILSMKVPIVAIAMFMSDVDTVTHAEVAIWSNFAKSDSDKFAREARNFMQTYNTCCGVHDYNDYKKIMKEPIDYPKSCCHDNECISNDLVIEVGCAEKVAGTYKSSFQTIAVLSLLVVIIEIFATLLCFHLPNLLIEKKGRGSANVRPSDTRTFLW